MDAHEWPTINMFSFLHLQNPIGNYFLSTNVPDTIFYENSIPRQWFFSKNSQLKMKSRAKLEDSYIQQYFSKFKQEIVAIWRTKVQILILDHQKLKEFFLLESQKEGILQRFVYPRGKYNFSILVHWTINYTFFEKFESKSVLADSTIDMYQRGLTYERDATLAQQIYSKSITERLEHFSSSVALHINDLMRLKYKLSRLQFEVKIDEYGNFWIINCLKMKWLKDESIHIKSLSLPSFVDEQKLILKQSKSIIKDAQCVMCNNLFHKNDVMKTKIKEILESWSFDHIGGNDKLITKQKELKLIKKKTILEKLELKQEVELREVNQNYLIPSLLRRIFPKLKYSQFQELKTNPGFIEMELSVCYDCHVQIDKGVNVNQDIAKLAKQEMLCPQNYTGLQGLRPEILKERFVTTRKEILNKISNKTFRKYSQTPATMSTFNSTNVSKIIGISPVKSLLTSALPKYSAALQETKIYKNTTSRTHSRRVSDIK